MAEPVGPSGTRDRDVRAEALREEGGGMLSLIINIEKILVMVL